MDNKTALELIATVAEAFAKAIREAIPQGEEDFSFDGLLQEEEQPVAVKEERPTFAEKVIWLQMHFKEGNGAFGARFGVGDSTISGWKHGEKPCKRREVMVNELYAQEFDGQKYPIHNGEIELPLSEKIKLILERTGYTQEMLAGKLGVVKGAIYNWLNGGNATEFNEIKINKLYSEVVR